MSERWRMIHEIRLLSPTRFRPAGAELSIHELVSEHGVDVISRIPKGPSSRLTSFFSACPLALVVATLPACAPDLSNNSLSPGPLEGSFAVSDFFSPSGFMGDGAVRGLLTQKRDEDCQPRREDARGSCFHFTYRPGEEGWSGVYFQYPANNWGSSAGRAVEDRYSKVTFEASARFSITYPEGAGVGESCGSNTSCRPGLACPEGTCSPERSRALGDNCLISAECSDGAQCVGQTCTEAGTADEMEPCGTGRDELCRSGLRCGQQDGSFVCLPDGNRDVGEDCSTRNECFSGLFCQEGTCVPRTQMGPFRFMVGGIQPTEANFEHADEIGVEYSPGSDKPPAVLSPDPQQFEIDLSGLSFSELIGAFMWASAFPDVDEVRREGPTPYRANLDEPAHIYFDDIVFVAAEGGE